MHGLSAENILLLRWVVSEYPKNGIIDVFVCMSINLNKSICTAFISFLSLTGYAQKTSEQIWLEYMVNYPFANSFNVENAFVYSNSLSGNQFRDFSYTPTLEYSLTQNIDFQGAATVGYTKQTESYNTFEVRPMLGSRIYFTRNRRIQVRLLLRYELRNLKNLEANSWETVGRPRARLETLLPINGKSIFEDKLWYGILDAELLYTKNEVEERFANRFRLRVGIGYRITYSSRFEFLYMAQQSKNAIDGDFETTENIFRLRYKHFLRKTSKAKIEGNGN